MCFNLSLQVDKHKIETSLNAKFKSDDSFEPFYFVSAFEHPTIPLKSSMNKDYLTPMQWGLIPNWAKTYSDALKIRDKTLNARFESMLQKPSFRISSQGNRCIIPASGFVEWQHIGSKKIPWFISLKHDELMLLAGIYNTWTNPETGEIINGFSIITLPANPLLEKIHNTKKRMPAMLQPHQAEAWLDPGLKTSEYTQVIKPMDQEFLKAYKVSPMVSNPSVNRNVPEVLKPYTYPEQTSLF